MVVSGVLDIVLGVIFIFLVFSLLVSGVGEVINKAIALRSRHLWRSLRKLLDGEGSQIAADQRPRASTNELNWTDRLYAHTLIRQLEGRLVTSSSRSRLSRIPTTDFSRAIVDLLAPNEHGEVTIQDVRAKIRDLPASSPLRAPLLAIVAEAGDELTRFREGVEDWFDARMDFLSATYKRHVKWILLAVAIVVVGVFNVDAIGAAQAFHRDEALRAAVAQEAVSLSGACGQRPEDELVGCIRDEVGKVTETIRLPVGWPDPDGINLWQAFGWLIASIAISQGAAFWFDVLRRTSTLRSR